MLRGRACSKPETGCVISHAGVACSRCLADVGMLLFNVCGTGMGVPLGRGARRGACPAGRVRSVQVKVDGWHSQGTVCGQPSEYRAHRVLGMGTHVLVRVPV